MLTPGIPVEQFLILEESQYVYSMGLSPYMSSLDSCFAQVSAMINLRDLVFQYSRIYERCRWRRQRRENYPRLCKMRNHGAPRQSMFGDRFWQVRHEAVMFEKRNDRPEEYHLSNADYHCRQIMQFRNEWKYFIGVDLLTTSHFSRILLL